MHELNVDQFSLEVSSNQVSSSITISHDNVIEYTGTLGAYGNFTIDKNTAGGSHNVSVVVAWTNSTGFIFTNTYVFDYWMDNYYFTVMDIIPATVGLAIQDGIDANSFNIFIDGARVLPLLPNDLSGRDTSEINQTFLQEGRIYIRSTAYHHSIKVYDKYGFLIYSNYNLDLRLYKYRVIEIPIVQMFFKNNLSEDIEISMYFFNETSLQYQQTESLLLPKSIEVRSIWVIAGNYSLRSWSVDSNLVVTQGGNDGSPNPYGSYTTINSYTLNDDTAGVVINAGGGIANNTLNAYNETLNTIKTFWASWVFSQQVYGNAPVDTQAQINSGLRNTIDAVLTFIDDNWILIFSGIIGVSIFAYALRSMFSQSMSSLFDRIPSLKGRHLKNLKKSPTSDPRTVSNRGGSRPVPTNALSKRDHRPRNKEGKLLTLISREKRASRKVPKGGVAPVGARSNLSSSSNRGIGSLSGRNSKKSLMNTSNSRSFRDDLEKAIKKKRKRR